MTLLPVLYVEVVKTPYLPKDELGYLTCFDGRWRILTGDAERVWANLARLATRGPQAAVMKLHLLPERVGEGP